MKKIYNTPAINVVIVEEENILAGSQWDVKGDYTGGLTVGARRRGAAVEFDDYVEEEDEETEW